MLNLNGQSVITHGGVVHTGWTGWAGGWLDGWMAPAAIFLIYYYMVGIIYILRGVDVAQSPNLPATRRISFMIVATRKKTFSGSGLGSSRELVILLVVRI